MPRPPRRRPTVEPTVIPAVAETTPGTVIIVDDVVTTTPTIPEKAVTPPALGALPITVEVSREPIKEPKVFTQEEAKTIYDATPARTTQRCLARLLSEGRPGAYAEYIRMTGDKEGAKPFVYHLANMTMKGQHNQNITRDTMPFVSCGRCSWNNLCTKNMFINSDNNNVASGDQAGLTTP